jgi:hypothetical protein
MPFGMPTMTERLTALRKLLRDVDGAEDGSFCRVFSAFLDLAEDPELMAGCEPARDDHLRPYLEAMVRRFTKDPALELRPMPVLHHGAADMFHGPVAADKYNGGWFYFNEGYQGLLALSEIGGLTHYVRISGLPVVLTKVGGASAGDYN